MCAVVGYSGTYDATVVSRLLENSRIRGVHSFGYSFCAGKTLKTRKFLDFNEFLDSINAEAPDVFIAHLRYSTSGDYREESNNQPLQDGNLAIAFNGVISQKPKSGIEKEYGIKMPSDNDGHVLLQKYTDKTFRNAQKPTFASVGINDGRLFGLRNNKRPLWKSVGLNATIFASTKDIFNRSGIDECELIRAGSICE